jgi:hypothetical protein
MVQESLKGILEYIHLPEIAPDQYLNKFIWGCDEFEYDIQRWEKWRYRVTKKSGDCGTFAYK